MTTGSAGSEPEGQTSVTPMTCPSGSAKRPRTAPGPGLNFGMITVPPSSAARASAASTLSTAT